MIVLCGTNRPDALTRRVANRVFSVLDDRLRGGTSDVAKQMDLAGLRPDIFSPDSYTKRPEWFLKEFQQPIYDAKGIVVVTPEYNGSFPGAFKYFIDMLSFPRSLDGLPIAFVGVAAGQFGALRAVEQLEMIFHYRGAHLFGTRLFIPKAAAAVHNDGTIGEHEPRLKLLIEGFIAFARGVGPLKERHAHG